MIQPFLFGIDHRSAHRMPEFLAVPVKELAQPFFHLVPFELEPDLYRGEDIAFEANQFGAIKQVGSTEPSTRQISVEPGRRKGLREIELE